MTLTGRPLLDNRVDAELFVGRAAELDALRAAMRRRLNVLVLGAPGVGRTTLLRALMYRSRRSATLHYVRGEGRQTGADLLDQIAREVLDTDQVGDPLTALRRAPDAPGVSVIVLDDVTAAAGFELFGRLRDELWELGHIWVVGSAESNRGSLLLPPADAFFERVLDLGPLSPAEGGELLARRTDTWTPRAAERIATAADGNPRRILTLAREVLDGLDALANVHDVSPADAAAVLDRVLDEVARRNAALRALGRPEAMLASELDALGAASASDDALLDRLGWTRARAVQVLGTLERAGLVVSAEVKNGPGRPKKVFRLTPPSQYSRERFA